MHAHPEDLAQADPFAPAFFRAMIAHHRGALRMSRELLRAAPRPELARFARGVITAQTAEIRRMRQFLAGTAFTSRPQVGPPETP